MTTVLEKLSTPINPRDAGIGMTLDEFDAAEFEPGYRYELIHGVLVVTPPPLEEERDANEELGYWLRKYQESHPDGQALDLTLPEQNLRTRTGNRRCDRAVWTGLGRRPRTRGRVAQRDVPSIVVEFTSSRPADQRRDYEEEVLEYRELGVQEYWIVDRFRRRMTVHRRRGSRWVRQPVGETETYRTPRLPGFELSLGKLLAVADKYREGGTVGGGDSRSNLRAGTYGSGGRPRRRQRTLCTVGPPETAEPRVHVRRIPVVRKRRQRADVVRGVFPFMLGLLGLLAAATVTPAWAESVLEIPAGDAVQHVLVNWPAEVGGGAAAGWELAERGGAESTVGAQRTAAMAADGTVADESGGLLATLPPPPNAAATRTFVLRPRAAGAALPAASFRFEDVDDKSLKLYDGAQPVFVYNHGAITSDKVPEKDRRRTRACYVHPVWGLNGEILTDDFPKDHYHHHGIFWTWPHVSIDGKEYDLWTSSNIEQRFLRWLYRQTGPVAAVLAVENGWFVGDRQVLTERIWLRVFRTGAGERALDIALVLVPGDKAVTLRGAEGKSYGGLTVRFDVWPRRDSTVRAPGHTVGFSGDGLASKEDLSNTRLAWADLSTQFPNSPQRSGAAVLVHPGHPDYPPSWLTRCYGCLCCGYPGVDGRTFEPGQPFRLDYRLWIHKDEAEHPRLESTYAAYCGGAKAAWKESH